MATPGRTRTSRRVSAQPGTPVPPSPIPTRQSTRNLSVRATSTRAPSLAPSMIVEREETMERYLERVLVKGDDFCVLERKGLPAEVEELINSADPYLDPLRAELDVVTGFGFIMSREYCLVWNWSRRSTSTTYMFPLPIPILSTTLATFSPLGFAALVPTASDQSTREPGLLVISVIGQVSYWESISLALSGVNKFKSGVVELNEGESIKGITFISFNLFSIMTSHERLFLLSIASIGGVSNITIRPFSNPQGWVNSVWTYLYKKNADPRAGILTFAVSKAENLGYAITNRNVQVWELPGTGEERLIMETDLFGGVLEALAGKKVGNEQWAMNEGKVDILDAKVTTGGHLAILISHVTETTPANSLSYAIVVLEIGNTPTSLAVVGIQRLAHQSPPDPRPNSSPRLSLTSNDIAFVAFPETLVLLSLDSGVEETVSLASANNRYLGFSTPTPTLHLLTASASILSVEPLLSTIELGVVGSNAYKTQKLKAKIDQAIFYAGLEENPLRFDIAGLAGDLQTAAERVSKEILNSSSNNMPSIIDLRAQLADRVIRAKSLIGFINQNGLLGKLSQSSRRELTWDAEKLEAGVALWHYYNSKLADSEPSFNLLSSAIESFMGDSSDDLVRVFFRTQITSISAILELVTKLTKNAMSTVTDPSTGSSVLFEANQIILLVFKATRYHRLTSASLYGLDTQILPLESWSTKATILDSLTYHFESTDALLRESTRVFEDRSDAASKEKYLQETREMLVELGEFIFAGYEERILFLTGTNLDGEKATELRLLMERYLAIRPKIVGTLVFHDRTAAAFQLTESYRDFNSLVQLCYKSSNAPERIQHLMHQYGEEFSFAVFSHLVEGKQYNKLLQMQEDWSELLTKFLDQRRLTEIDWLNDFAIGRFDHAVHSLTVEAYKEEDLAEKKMTLSLAKLSQIAQATSDSIESESVQRAIEAIDDRLDLVNSQLSLLALFDLCLSAMEARGLTSTQAELITSRLAPGLECKPALLQMYTQLVQRLIDGITLSAEDLIDLFSLKLNEKDHASHFSSALDILIRAKGLPAGRQNVALQSIWRRLYVQDDWIGLRNATGLTDEQVVSSLKSTALYATLTASQGSNLPSNFFLSPIESIFADSQEEIAARFPEAGEEILAALVTDLELENEGIRIAVEEGGLLEYYREIQRLFAEEMN